MCSYAPYTPASYGNRSPYHMDRPEYGASLAHESNIYTSPDTTRTPVVPCSPPSSMSQPTTPNSPHSPHDQIDIRFDVKQQDLALVTVPGYDFDPTKRKFTLEELKPQPILKRSRKVFMCEDYKDEKYWNRRKKNNFAAKRSRDAHRVKENQIAMRVSYLEKEHEVIRMTLVHLQKETISLKQRLEKYESNSPGVFIEEMSKGSSLRPS